MNATGVHSQDKCRCGHTLAQHYQHGGTDEIRCDFCKCEWFTDDMIACQA